MTTCVPARPGPPSSRPVNLWHRPRPNSLGRDGKPHAGTGLQDHITHGGRCGVQRVRPIADADPSRAPRLRAEVEGAVAVGDDLTDDLRPTSGSAGGRGHVQRGTDDRCAVRGRSRPVIVRVRPYATTPAFAARCPDSTARRPTSRTDSPPTRSVPRGFVPRPARERTTRGFRRHRSPSLGTRVRRWRQWSCRTPAFGRSTRDTEPPPRSVVHTHPRSPAQVLHAASVHPRRSRRMRSRRRDPPQRS